MIGIWYIFIFILYVFVILCKDENNLKSVYNKYLARCFTMVVEWLEDLAKSSHIDG